MFIIFVQQYIFAERNLMFTMYLLEDDPRSTPGHSKVLDQIRAIMKLMIVVNTVGLTKSCLDVTQMGRNI